MHLKIISDASLIMTRSADMMSRTGMNGGVIINVSSRKKLIAKSSNGAEFTALNEAVT